MTIYPSVLAQVLYEIVQEIPENDTASTSWWPRRVSSVWELSSLQGLRAPYKLKLMYDTYREKFLCYLRLLQLESKVKTTGTESIRGRGCVPGPRRTVILFDS